MQVREPRELLFETPETKYEWLPHWPKNSAKIHPNYLDTTPTLCNWRPARKPACEEQNDKTFPTSGRLLIDDHSSCHCFCTKDRTQPCKLLFACLWSIPSLEARPEACSRVVEEHDHPHLQQLQDGSSSNPGSPEIGRPQWTIHI